MYFVDAVIYQGDSVCLMESHSASHSGLLLFQHYEYFICLVSVSLSSGLHLCVFIWTQFSALHDQLASLDRDAQLMPCFSAMAELLVLLLTFSCLPNTCQLTTKNLFVENISFVCCCADTDPGRGVSSAVSQQWRRPAVEQRPRGIYPH